VNYSLKIDRIKLKIVAFSLQFTSGFYPALLLEFLISYVYEIFTQGINLLNFWKNSVLLIFLLVNKLYFFQDWLFSNLIYKLGHPKERTC